MHIKRCRRAPDSARWSYALARTALPGPIPPVGEPFRDGGRLQSDRIPIWASPSGVGGDVFIRRPHRLSIALGNTMLITSIRPPSTGCASPVPYLRRAPSPEGGKLKEDQRSSAFTRIATGHTENTLQHHGHDSVDPANANSRPRYPMGARPVITVVNRVHEVAPASCVRWRNGTRLRGRAFLRQ